MTQIEEYQRRAENMMRFFAMDSPNQLQYIGPLPHDHGHPQFLGNPNVIRLQMIVDNFLEFDPTLVRSKDAEPGFERDMQWLIMSELEKSNPQSLWSRQGLQRHALWRILRLLARETLKMAKVPVIPPTVQADELCCR